MKRAVFLGRDGAVHVRIRRSQDRPFWPASLEERTQLPFVLNDHGAANSLRATAKRKPRSLANPPMRPARENHPVACSGKVYRGSSAPCAKQVQGINECKLKAT
jgi:hypothetical protein